MVGGAEFGWCGYGLQILNVETPIASLSLSPLPITFYFTWESSSKVLTELSNKTKDFQNTI